MKPDAFNYGNYQKAVSDVVDLTKENERLHEKIDRLIAENNNLKHQIVELLDEKIAVQPITCAMTETDGINFRTVVKYKCPTCGAFIRRTFSARDDYCGRCGKRIDWGI